LHRPCRSTRLQGPESESREECVTANVKGDWSAGIARGTGPIIKSQTPAHLLMTIKSLHLSGYDRLLPKIGHLLCSGKSSHVLPA